MLPVNLPALCERLRFRADGRVPVVNSLDVAAEYEKYHHHVLRDIQNLLEEKPDLVSRNWFRRTAYISEQGKSLPSYDLTRGGFTLLVQGWTGPKALEFKVSYIDAFDLMEELLNSRPDITTHEELIGAIRELVRPLAIRFDDQDRSIEQVGVKVDGVREEVDAVREEVKDVRGEVEEIKQHLKSKIRAAGKKHERLLIYVVSRFYGGKSPVTGVQIVDEYYRLIRGPDGKPLAEIEHFYTVDNPHITNFWLVDKTINEGLRTGRISRPSIERHFCAFQENLKIAQGGKIIEFPKRKKPPPQSTLF